MDADRFESLLRSLSGSPSRRNALRLVTGLILGSLLLGADPLAARKKRGKGKRKKRKRGSQTSPPPVPVPVLAYQCPGPRESGAAAGFPGTTRFAQTFTATQGGSLRQIQIEVQKEAGTTGDYVVELLDFGTDGKPTNTVLATATVPNGSVSDGFSTLTATFSGPLLTAGAEYAAACSRPGGNQLEVTTRTGDDCAGSAFFQSSNGTGAFAAVASGDDLVSTVTVLV